MTGDFPACRIVLDYTSLSGDQEGYRPELFVVLVKFSSWGNSNIRVKKRQNKDWALYKS